MKQANTWTVIKDESKETKYQLFCFPYAGGNSSIFWNWKKNFPSDIAVLPMEMPGKGRRISEKLYTHMEPLVHDLKDWMLKNSLKDFVLFGHSLGALICFELAKLLDTFNIIPTLLIVSGCSSFQRAFKNPAHQPLHKLSDQKLIEAVKKFNGTPQELLDDPSFITTFLPILRADISILDNYSPLSQRRLRCPILALAGTKDFDAPVHAMQDWRNHTDQAFEITSFEGDHFFIHSCENEIIKFITEKLKHPGLNQIKPGLKSNE